LKGKSILPVIKVYFASALPEDLGVNQLVKLRLENGMVGKWYYTVQTFRLSIDSKWQQWTYSMAEDMLIPDDVAVCICVGVNLFICVHSQYKDLLSYQPYDQLHQPVQCN